MSSSCGWFNRSRMSQKTLMHPKICRRLGISEQSYYRWRKEYGGLKMDQAKGPKDLEKENARRQAGPKARKMSTTWSPRPVAIRRRLPRRLGPLARLAATLGQQVERALDRGGRSAAIAYTPIDTAKLNGVDPQAGLTDTLDRIADHKINRDQRTPPLSMAAEFTYLRICRSRGLPSVVNALPSRR